jgi:toprim domain protein
MDIVIIVEGANDRKHLQKYVTGGIEILCTYGTPGTERVDELRRQVGDREVYVFTDNDKSGRKIRAILSETFPDAGHLYTKKGYAGVEGTPEEHLIQQLEKAGLEDYIVYPASCKPLADEKKDPCDREHAEFGRRKHGL